MSEDLGVNGLDQENDQSTLHFFDCIGLGELQCDGIIVLSCFEAALHALKCRFPHDKMVIIQTDDARNLSGKQMTLLLPHVCSASGFHATRNQGTGWSSGCQLVAGSEYTSQTQTSN